MPANWYYLLMIPFTCSQTLLLKCEKLLVWIAGSSIRQLSASDGYTSWKTDVYEKYKILFSFETISFNTGISSK